MAITVGTTAPIAAHSVHGGKSPNVFSTQINSTQTVVAGSILVLSSGKASVGNAAQTAGLILGVALQPKASVATAGDNDLVTYALARGQVFTGNMVTDATTDYAATVDYANFTGQATLHDTVALTVQGYPAIDFDDTTGGMVSIFGFAREQGRGKNFVSGTGTDRTINPRVYFCFAATGTV